MPKKAAKGAAIGVPKAPAQKAAQKPRAPAPEASPQVGKKKAPAARKEAAKPKPKAKPRPLVVPKAEPAPRTESDPESGLDAEESAQKGGRPSLFRPEYVEIAHRLCSIMGATNKQLAEYLGFSERTIERWQLAHPEFGRMLKLGKLEADSKVAERLYQAAIGYEHPDIDIRTVSLGGNAGSEVVKTPYTKIIEPDVSAIQWWLKNRQGDKWKDKTEQTIEHVSLDMETADARFASKMNAALEKAAEVRARRNALGMAGD